MMARLDSQEVLGLLVHQETQASPVTTDRWGLVDRLEAQVKLGRQAALVVKGTREHKAR